MCRQKFQAIKVQISSQMVPWLQKFCDHGNTLRSELNLKLMGLIVKNRNSTSGDSRDGFQVLMSILHNQTGNYLRYKRDLRHLEERVQPGDERGQERGF